ncbi:MAG: glycerophosphodiester phosphodiesterase family protein [Cyclobacteriaceae bacterium]
MRFRYPFVVYIIMAAFTISCNSDPRPAFDVQGHRGTRGLMPENTIPGFKAALDLGVTTLELDVVISLDSQVVVSHEPWLSSEICRLPDGTKITGDGMVYNMYKMTYDSISRFDCGSEMHPRFPDQKKVRVSKPLLKQVFEEVESYHAGKDNRRVDYNIEIKSRPAGDNLYHPTPGFYSDLVYTDLKNSGIDMSRFIIQSFDFRVLRYWHETYPGIRLATLVEGEDNPARTVAGLKEELGFLPEIYSPDYHLLTLEVIRAFQEAGVRVIPWTANDPAEMERLRSKNIDGLITDYPDRAQFLIRKP